MISKWLSKRARTNAIKAEVRQATMALREQAEIYAATRLNKASAGPLLLAKAATILTRALKKQPRRIANPGLQDQLFQIYEGLVLEQLVLADLDRLEEERKRLLPAAVPDESDALERMRTVLTDFYRLKRERESRLPIDALLAEREGQLRESRLQKAVNREQTRLLLEELRRRHISRSCFGRLLKFK